MSIMFSITLAQEREKLPLAPYWHPKTTNQHRVTRNIGFGHKGDYDWALLASRAGVGSEGPLQAQAAYSAHNH